MGKPRHRPKHGGSPRASGGRGSRSPARQAVKGPGLHTPSRCAQTATSARTRPALLALHMHLGWPGPSQRPWHSLAPTQGYTAHPTDHSSSPTSAQGAHRPLPSLPHPTLLLWSPGAPLVPPTQAAHVCHSHQSSGCQRTPSHFPGSCLRRNGRKESEGPLLFTGEPQACPSIFWLPASAQPRAPSSDGDSGSVAAAARSHEALRPSRRAQEGAELPGSGPGCCAAG